MTNKNISTVLFLVVGLVLIGLLSRWNFNTWRIIDGIIVLVLVFLGIVLIKKDELKFKNMLIIFKSKKFWMVVIVLIILLILSFVSIFVINKIKEENLKCKFSLINVVENRYQEDEDEKYISCPPPETLFQKYRNNLNGCENGKGFQPARHFTYWEIDGMLKNESQNNQYLNTIILKIYTNDGRKILLTENFIYIKKTLTSGQSYPFQIRAQINRDSEIGKYFNKDDKVKIDMYPYFLSCSY